MFNKKIIMLILAALLLTGCSSETPASKEQAKEVEKILENNELEQKEESEPKSEPKSEPEVKNEVEVTESEIGKLTVVSKNKEVGEVKESGPFTIKLNKMQVAELVVKESYKSMFDDKDIVTVITLEVEVENKSPETNSIYPDQGTIVTNTKEQKESNIFLSDSVGGDYIGEVVKKGNVIFILDSKATEVTSFKYIIGGPSDSDWDKLGEDIVFELSF